MQLWSLRQKLLVVGQRTVYSQGNLRNLRTGRRNLGMAGAVVEVQVVARCGLDAAEARE